LDVGLDSGLVLVSVLTVSENPIHGLMPRLLPFHHDDFVLILDPEGVVE
jgi:hypothetical protein